MKIKNYNDVKKQNDFGCIIGSRTIRFNLNEESYLIDYITNGIFTVKLIQTDDEFKEIGLIEAYITETEESLVNKSIIIINNFLYGTYDLYD